MKIFFISLIFIFSTFGVFAQSMSAQPSKDSTNLTILPTLKGHMARLGSLMNFLFRNIDDEKHTKELIAAVSEMKVLIKGTKAFKPDKALKKLDPEKHEEAIAQFQSCLVMTLEKLNKLERKLSQNDGKPARPILFELDIIRRDCHTKFG